MIFRIVALWLVLSWLTACASFTKARETNLPAAQRAHTRADLVAAIGEPTEREMRDEGEVWYYTIYSDDSTRSYHYTAKLSGERVVDFYADSSHETADERESRIRTGHRGPSGAF